jgi:hypothetical protein
LDDGQGDRFELLVEAGHGHGGGAHQPTPRVPVSGDGTAGVGLHPGREDVGEPEAVGLPQRLDVLDDIGGRLVVVGESGVEGHPGTTPHGLRRDPRQGGH